MERQETMDYTAVVHEYLMNGGGQKMKEWCQKEGYDMNNISPVDYVRHLTGELADGKSNKQQLLPRH